MTVPAKQFLTEFTGTDGEVYAGPIILADCLDGADAVMSTSLQGPSGQPLRLVGELVFAFDASDGSGDRHSQIRRLS